MDGDREALSWPTARRVETRSRPGAILGSFAAMSKDERHFPIRCAKKALWQADPARSRSLRGEHSSCLHEFRYPDIEIRGRVIVDHQARGEDREVNRPL